MLAAAQEAFPHHRSWEKGMVCLEPEPGSVGYLSRRKAKDSSRWQEMAMGDQGSAAALDLES